jgi:hypothetical protein
MGLKFLLRLVGLRQERFDLRLKGIEVALKGGGRLFAPLELLHSL